VEIAFSRSKSSLSAEDFAFQIAAVDVQMRRDFAPLWGIEPWPCVAYNELPDPQADPDYRPIWYSDQIGLEALGFHANVLGYVFGRVLTPMDPLDASTASHEAVEMRADPDCTLFAPMGDGREVAVETGDPVEADEYGITVKIGSITRTVAVSNFVLPAYFEPGSKGPWDFLGKLRAPAPAMTPGGYLIIRDPASGEVSNIFAGRAAERRFASKWHDLSTRTGRRVAMMRKR